MRDTYAAHKRIVFDGDGYSEEWHEEADSRGSANLPTTPDALPWIVEASTVAAFERYNVLSSRVLEARYEVFVEQVLDQAQHRSRDRGGDRPDDDPAGGGAPF